MAASPSSDPRTPLSLSSPSQIPKDMPGADNTIPLSPQWLLPKPGEHKSGMTPVENHPSPFGGYGDRSDAIKSPGNGEEMYDNQKKKDVFRPTFMDMDSGRRDRWRDEERDTNPAIRRDRWREGDKEIGDGRKTDRWVDNLSTKPFGEARRGPADRWADPSREANPTREANPSREANHDQRRESKWNTRWGPDNKDMGKWTDAAKYDDMPLDKGLPHLGSHGKDEREGDHYRPWRPSSLQNRGRGEPQVTGKEVPTFSHGRGRSENAASTFSVGRGRANFGGGSTNNYSGHSHTSGFVADRDDTSHGEPSPFRYSRTKLLDIYRLTDVRSSNKILDGFIQVPPLTQDEPVEPLALCAPTSEEHSIFKGIDKGDIVSSGAPQVSKDGSTGRSSAEFMQSRRTKLGSRDDVSLALDDGNDKVDSAKSASSKVAESLSHDKQGYPYVDGRENPQIYAENKYSVEASRDDDAGLRKGRVSAHSETPWRSPSVAEHARTPSRDWVDVPSDSRPRRSDISWSQAMKERSNGWEKGLTEPSYAQNELNWQIGEDSTVRKHPSVAADRELESRNLLQPSPEELVLYYKDPHGQIQGPFPGIDIIGWFEAGYFGIDLQVRVANAPKDTPFSMLGDVMPHLRAKARPPPGFNTAKQNEVNDVSSRSSLSGISKVLPGPSGINSIANELRHTHGSSKEAENRFLESLMSGDISSHLARFGSTEGLQGFGGHTSSVIPPVGAESVDALNLLSNRMDLERQKSLSHPYAIWPPRDVATVAPSPDIIRDSTMPQANLLASTGDVPRQSHPQNVEMSVNQGLSDRSSAGMNNGHGGWPNFSVQGGVDTFKEKIDLHQGQNFHQAAYGIQQHKLQQQNQPSITSLLPHTLESPNNLADKLLSSGLAQDPQVLNLLQQQYLLQLQSQQTVPGPQLSILDKLLLLQQQQKQEEQQKLLQHQLLQQQQQLLSKVLTEQQLVQRFADASYGNLQAPAVPVGTVSINTSAPQLSHMFQVNSQVPVSGMLDVRSANMPPNASQDLSHTVSEGSYLNLPHQILGDLQKAWPTMPAHSDSIRHSDPLPVSVIMGNSAAPEAAEKTPQHSNAILGAPPIGRALLVNSESVEPASVAEIGVRALENEILKPERTNDAKVIRTGAVEESPGIECSEEISPAKEARNVEVREIKKTSDKKSKKQKSSKAQPSSDQVKGSSKTSSVQLPKLSEADGTHHTDKSAKFDRSVSGTFPSGLPESLEAKTEQTLIDSSTHQNAQVNSAQRAWKPATCVKPKSLLEIQQEEQRRAQREIPVSATSSSVSSMSSSTPWAGVVAPMESKVSKEIHQSSKGEQNMGKAELSKSKKSGLHDLLAAEVLAKSNERMIDVSDMGSSLPPLPTMSSQLDTVDDDNFIEAKDTKKSRKKAAKAKGAAAKVSGAISGADVTASSPVEKGKSVKHLQTEKEVLPAPPSGPSLGDFVPWKGESTSPSPAPAWSAEPAKPPKAMSLRDILREQEKKVPSVQQPVQISTPQKSQSVQNRAGSWSVPASSPSKAASPIQMHSNVSSQSKHRGEDDLFWGPPEQSKQETRQADFPQLGNHGGRANKTTPVKGAASLNRQKSTGGRAAEQNFSASPATAQISVKGKKGGSTKNSEAMDFRDWCESESIRLTGSKDTSFLEFCLKQSRSEAETLLIENLGSFDPSHEFIEKFLNYMELLSADVLEMAFQSRNDLKAYNNGARDMTSGNAGFGDTVGDSGASADGSAKGGKKKGKKGKKVSPSVLGFNVVSNRIMMGEIQTVED